ncbi:low temperature requirement protein A [Micromonospora sp. WMMD558]|uniref:low temperature requirement protein A n=1 Tax=unclassified Micromonospora TaxID=2617518 RepID=UPI0012B48B9D|nr:low temperature requirement protein A [Micromonospora sp. WMMC415]QGN48210.1 low temperature requirement protein A [Micromonospora sp. WMMC415]
MTTSRADGLLRRPGASQATFLELFFDLAFVFALAQLSYALVQHLTWSGAFQASVLLLAVWWVWFTTAWITELFDPHRPAIQMLTIAMMVGALIMAVALPDAFGAQGLVFAGVYVAIHIGRDLFLVVALRGHDLRRSTIRGLFWFGLSALPWLAGALVHGPARGALWTLAVALDYTAYVLRHPTPRIGRTPAAQLPSAAEHLAERYRQFYIIALGELILLAGLTMRGTAFTGHRTVAFLVSITTAVLLWRIYIFRAGELLSAAIAAAPDPARRARFAFHTHLAMVAGVVVTSVGAELVIAHPLGHSRPAWAAVVLGGPALFLAGRATFEYVVFARVSRSRLTGLLALAALAPAMPHVPPLLSGVAATAVLAGVAAADAARARRHPPEPLSLRGARP